MRRRVLIVQPSLQPPGGGKTAWRRGCFRRCRIVTIWEFSTWQPVDVDEMNRFYGTSVRSIEEQLTPVTPAVRAVCDLLPFSLTLLKRALLFRATRHVHATGTCS